MHPGAQLVRTAGGRAVGALYRPACNSPSVRGPCVVASPAGVVLGGRRCGSATVSPHEREPNRGSAAARAAHRGRKSPVRCRGRAAARLDLSRCRSDFQIITHRTLHQASEVRRHILPIDFSGSDLALTDNLSSRRQARVLLDRGGALALFPGGGVASPKCERDSN